MKTFIVKLNLYIPKNFNNSNTKKAGQTNAFRTPKTPIQKLGAVEI